MSRALRYAPAFGLALSLAVGLGSALGLSTEARAEPPFALDSPWNLRPVDPVLGDYMIPRTLYRPFVGPGDYSTGVFTARASDPPMTVLGAEGSEGLWSADEEAFRPVTVPRWPSDVQAAVGTDGHADIVDPVDGVIHSFWQLRFEDGRWRATQYAWAPLNGRGWGDPAHYFQGARAAGVPSLGGLIRKDEVDDGRPWYRHALALSLDGSGLKSGYVFPATSEDRNHVTDYRGGVPMGALLMLPADFDTASVRSPALRKVAATLKRYGARVVDMNHDTRYYIYVENGADFDLHRGGWNHEAGEDLERIGDALRTVTGQRAWLDHTNKLSRPDQSLNLLSLRGPWQLEQGSQAARFDSWEQTLIFPESERPIVQVQRQGNGLRATSWSSFEAGRRYRLSVRSVGGARLALRLRNPDGTVIWDGRSLGNGQSIEFAVPDQPWRVELVASGGLPAGPSWLGARLVEVLSAPSAPTPRAAEARAPQRDGGRARSAAPSPAAVSTNPAVGATATADRPEPAVPARALP